MKTDRELLELAARAAGIALHSWSEIEQGYRREDGGYFRPLTDDGDALRLAVALRFSVFAGCDWCTVRGGTKKAKSDTRFKIVQHYGWDDDYTQDRAKGTRRAITRAAAAIGERE